MPTIVLQYDGGKAGRPTKPLKANSETASVSASPGRYHYATVGGRARTFERVGVDASGNEIFRDQNRR
jgi:hypothetical protein